MKDFTDSHCRDFVAALIAAESLGADAAEAEALLPYARRALETGRAIPRHADKTFAPMFENELIRRAAAGR